MELNSTSATPTDPVFPIEVFQNILPLVTGAKELCRISCVCRALRSMVMRLGLLLFPF